MSVINGIISSQSFEIVRDRIGAILADEFANQALLTGDPALKAKVFVERFIAFGHSELPAINILFDREEFVSRTAVDAQGLSRYIVQCYTSAKTDDVERGDTKAMIKLQKMLGIVRAIIMDPKYVTLGFANPFIWNREIESITVADPGRTPDATNSVTGRIIVLVKMPETTELISPTLAAGFDTTVRLEETEMGYRFIDDNIY